MSSGTRVRPTGVTVLAVLEILGGILSLVGAAGMFALGAIAEDLPGMGALGGFFGLFGALIGGVLVVFALIAFALAYGFWTGKGWAWILGIVFSILGLVLGLVSIIGNPSAVINVIINGVILYYLTRSHVKAWFGRA